MEQKKQGFTDEAAQQDLFEINKYINGLAKFIENCNTPMTISIQGAWGTGKTSIMQITRNILAGNGQTHNIWFNTWQFSQFNMDDTLAISLLSCLLDELSVSNEQKAKLSKTTQAINFAQNVGKLGKDIFLSMLEVSAGSKITERVEKGIDKTQEFFAGQEQINSATAIKNLKEQFSECVEETLANTKKSRVVVFIDDLDRLEPRKAVELLEVLKLFLDCKNCVFILAIDYEVVCKGVEAKYGKLAENITDNREKGKSFFDKIIQVPFKVPVAEYNIQNYVANCFDEIGINCPDIKDYIDLIKLSIGTNPRSMKRLFNAYLLLTMVISEEILEYDRNKQLLFAVLCIQHSFEKIYNYIVGRKDTITANELQVLSVGNIQEINEKLDDIELDEYEAERLQPFMAKFLQTMDIDKDGSIGEQELDNLRNVLGISTISSSSEEIRTTRYAEEVFDVNELDIGDKDPKELETLIEKIKEIGSDVTCSMRNAKNYSHILFKNDAGKSFADIYMRKAGFAIDCIPSSKSVHKKPEIKELFKRYEGTKTVRPFDRYITISVKDDATEKDFLILAKICYESYK